MLRKIKKDKYYRVEDDIKRFPEAWLYMTWSARGGSEGAGKTYGTLKYFLENKQLFCLMKRTKEDVDFITKKSKKFNSASANPFKALNRDLNINIQAEYISSGFGVFYEADLNDNPIGEPLGFIVALASVKHVKGFDISECDWLFFDEFIPLAGERVLKTEGDSILSIYKSIQRDRKLRGRPPLKMICMANASNISNPLFLILEVINDVATMSDTHSDIKYLKDRGIVLHSLFWDVKEDELDGLDKAMIGTQWFENNVRGGFTYNDMSNVRPNQIKNMQCVVRFKFKNHYYYIYNNNGNDYVSTSKANKFLRMYDLNFENHQKKFYFDEVLDLQNACINGRLKVIDYQIYDLIMNYKNYYNVRC